MNKEPPVQACCGRRHWGAICADGKVMCCLCFNRFALEQLNITSNGKREDVCTGCALKEETTRDA